MTKFFFRSVAAQSKMAEQTRELLHLWDIGEISRLEFSSHLAAIAKGNYGLPELGDEVKEPGADAIWRVVGLDNEKKQIMLSGPGPCRGMREVSFEEFGAWRFV